MSLSPYSDQRVDVEKRETRFLVAKGLKNKKCNAIYLFKRSVTQTQVRRKLRYKNRFKHINFKAMSFIIKVKLTKKI